MNKQYAPERAQQRAFQRLQKTLRGTHISQQSQLQKYDSYKNFVRQTEASNYKSIETLIQETLMTGEKKPLFRDSLKFVGLSSGTTSTSAKKIPYNIKMLRSFEDFEKDFAAIIQRHCHIAPSQIDHLTWGSSVQVDSTADGIPCGYVSGYLSQSLPWIMRRHAFPKTSTSLIQDPNKKIMTAGQEIRPQNLELISGVPAYLIHFLESLKEEWNLKDFHEIWPNLKTCVYSATNIDAYRTPLNELVGQEMNYIGAYLATEGPIGWEIPSLNGQTNGIYSFYLGDIIFGFRKVGEETTRIMTIGDLAEGDEVELLISCPNGLLNYQTGDCLRIKSVRPSVNFEIMGRLNHGLNVATEKVSMTELHRSIHACSQAIGKPIHHFFLFPGQQSSGRPCYQWTLIVDHPEELNRLKLAELLDAKLKEMNEDYRENREELHFLERPRLSFLPKQNLDQFFARNSHRGQLKVPISFDTEEAYQCFLKDKFLSSEHEAA